MSIIINSSFGCFYRFAGFRKTRKNKKIQEKKHSTFSIFFLFSFVFFLTSAVLTFRSVPIFWNPDKQGIFAFLESRFG